MVDSDLALVLARRLAPVPGQVDSLGNDQADYCQMFLLKMHEHPGDSSWMNRLLTNTRYSFLRSLGRSKQVWVEDLEPQHPGDRQMEAACLLSELADSPYGEDLEILVALASAGSVRELHDRMGLVTTRRCLSGKIKSARRRLSNYLGADHG